MLGLSVRGEDGGALAERLCRRRDEGEKFFFFFFATVGPSSHTEFLADLVFKGAQQNIFVIMNLTGLRNN